MQRPCRFLASKSHHYAHVQPSKKSLQSIKDRVTELTKRTRTAKLLEWVVNEVNATVRGWVGYFHYRNCAKSLAQTKGHVEERCELISADDTR
jgi:hypothetical protein